MAEKAKFRARACPRDHTPLRPSTVAVVGPDVTIDACPKCEGIFLDKNELVRLTGDAKLNSYLRDQVHVDTDSDILCPHCGGLMDEEDANGVVVDVCLTCYGLWLDKGELDVLRARKNTADIEITDAKRAEALDADAARKYAKARGRAEQGRGVGGAVRRRFLWLDDTLDEFVRRYL